MRTPARGQTLLLMSLTMLLLALFVCMTLSIGMRARRKMELQTLSDAAAYSQSIATARTFNSMALLNRASASHWVALIGIQADHAWGTIVPAYLEGYAAAANAVEAKILTTCPGDGAAYNKVDLAKKLFYHQELSLWQRPGPSAELVDPVNLPGVIQRQPYGNSFGALDRAVKAEATQVRDAAVDLANLQLGLYGQIKNVLQNQNIPQQIVLNGLGAAAGPVTVERPNAGGGKMVGFREVDQAFGAARFDQLQLMHTSLASRGTHFPVGGQVDWQQGHPRIPHNIYVLGNKVVTYINGLAGGPKLTINPGSYLLATYFDNGTDCNAASQPTQSGGGTPPPPGTVEHVVPYTDPNRYSRVGPVNVTSQDDVIALKGDLIGNVGLGYQTTCGKVWVDMPVQISTRVFSNGPYDFVSHYWGPFCEQGSHSDAAFQLGWDYFWGHGGEKGETTSNWAYGMPPPGWYDNHPNHQYWGVLPEAQAHRLGPELSDPIHGTGTLGLMPGAIGFIFPSSVTAAGGLYGQPKTPILLTRANSGPGVPKDPWDLAFKFRFANTGPGGSIDLQHGGANQLVASKYMAVLSNSVAYYHRRRVAHDGMSWKEPPNLLNPFWHATLAPIDIDEFDLARGIVDKTPVNPGRPPDAPAMLTSVSLNSAAAAYNALKAAGYKGIQ